MTKLHKAMIGAFVIVLLALALYPYFRGTTPWTLLDHEIELQTQKQVKLDEANKLHNQILEIRKQRNELQKQKVCTGTGSDCYLSAF